jgi:hypothetical protein
MRHRHLLALVLATGGLLGVVLPLLFPTSAPAR